MNQLDLFETTAPARYDDMPAPQPPERTEGERRAEAGPVVVGTVADEKKRTTRLREAVLALLKAQVSATNFELEEVGGNRFGARIHELRKEGHNIEIVKLDRKTGITIYRLKEGT